MKSIVKLLSVSSCCLAIGITTANAESMLLADAELDRVTAGDSQPTQSGFPFPFFGGTITCVGIGCLGVFLPAIFGPGDPNGPMPVEPPGCETGACQPGPVSLFGRIAPIGFPFIPRLLSPTSGHFGFPDPTNCGPACSPVVTP